MTHQKTRMQTQFYSYITVTSCPKYVSISLPSKSPQNHKGGLLPSQLYSCVGKATSPVENTPKARQQS